MSKRRNFTISTVLTVTTAAGIHLLNNAIHISARIDHLIQPESGKYYEWKFGNIYYTKRGKGIPVLLIHDLNTYSTDYEWHLVVDELSKYRTVYTIDLLGCGRSDKPNLTYTNYLYVQLIQDFIKNVIGKKSDVIVTGYSSSFILGVCQNHKDLIDNVVMINPSDISKTAHIPTSSSRMLTKLILLPLVGTLLYNILVSKNHVENIFRESYFYDKSKIKNEQIRTYYEAAHYSNPDSKYLFSSIVGNYLTANVRLYMNDLTNSIFMITGSKEKNQNDADQYKKILPSAEIFTIDKTGYLPQLESPGKLLDQIKVCLNID